MKTYVGIARDHSGSMGHLVKQAKDDYNNLVKELCKASNDEGIDTIVNTVAFGLYSTGRYGSSRIQKEILNSSINAIKPLDTYPAEGGTPLWDAVGELIDTMKLVPDANENGVNFLVMVVTDGQNNESTKWTAERLTEEINKLQATDKWTFTFRVPQRYASSLCKQLGIPAGNIIEWEQTEKGMKESSVQTQSAVKKFYAGTKAGQTRSTAFYADLSSVSMKDIKDNLADISAQVSVWTIKNGGVAIKEFVEKKIKPEKMQLGTAFYQLTKKEEIQDFKLFVVRNKFSGKIYGGREARELIGLPASGTIKVAPGDHGNFDVFVQSTSTNRKLIAGTELLYWPKARSH